jgi:hypothetical protein
MSKLIRRTSVRAAALAAASILVTSAAMAQSPLERPHSFSTHGVVPSQGAGPLFGNPFQGGNPLPSAGPLQGSPPLTTDGLGAGRPVMTFRTPPAGAPPFFMAGTLPQMFFSPHAAGPMPPLGMRPDSAELAGTTHGASWGGAGLPPPVVLVGTPPGTTSFVRPNTGPTPANNYQYTQTLSGN